MNEKYLPASWTCPICGYLHAVGHSNALHSDYHNCKGCGKIVMVKTEVTAKPVVIVSVSKGLVDGIYSTLSNDDLSVVLLDFDSLDRSLDEEEIDQDGHEYEYGNMRALLDLAAKKMNTITY